MGRPETSWRKRQIALRAFYQGSPAAEAAELAGIAASTVESLATAHHGVMPKAICVRDRELTLEDREEIRAGIERNESNAQIGERIGFSRSTVWREIKRNEGRSKYRATNAQRCADAAARRARPSWVQTRPQLWAKVQELLRSFWSPEQISLWLRDTYPTEPEWWVSHESIYQALYVQTKGSLRKELAACLRSGRIKRRSQARHRPADSQPIPNLVSISDRPAEVEDRAVPGHWEGDLIIGAYNRSAVATLVERSTRFGMLIKIDSKNADHVAARLAEHVLTLPKALRRSLTWDRGTELAGHQQFSIATDVPVYFCDPHSPWQRGTNENWNGLVRQFLPKGTDLSQHSQTDLDHMADLLNSRPRKTLNIRTPAQALADLVAATT